MEQIQTNVSKFVKYYLDYLQKEGFKLFQKYPTIEIFRKRNDLVGLALIEENVKELNCYFVKEPRRGEDYLFISVEELIQEGLLQNLGENYAREKLEQKRADKAYSINLQRVENLLKDGHYAVALVFLVSAFENFTKDLFFLYNDLWFPLDDDFNDEIYIKVGVIINYEISEAEQQLFYSEFRVIDNIRYGIEKILLDKAEKWKLVKYWEKILQICNELRVYDEYILKKQGINGKEIGNFEILKGILKKKANEMKFFNFQRIYKEGGIRWLFTNFFNIDLTGFKKTFKLLSGYIKKRHQIIHGTLNDEQINELMVQDFKSRILKFISYLRDELHYRYRENFSWGIQ